MNRLTETTKKGYRFKNAVDAQFFAASFSPPVKFSLKKGLPLWKGQANTGWTVFIKAYSVAQELQIDVAYRKLNDDLKVVHP